MPIPKKLEHGFNKDNGFVIQSGAGIPDLINTINELIDYIEKTQARNEEALRYLADVAKDLKYFGISNRLNSILTEKLTEKRERQEGHFIGLEEGYKKGIRDCIEEAVNYSEILDKDKFRQFLLNKLTKKE